MMSKKVENAKNLYLEGIKDGDIDVIDKYSGNRYTQHSTGVKDGPDGFKEFFRDFLIRTNKRDIQIIRAFEDGNYVFVHAYQDIDNGSAKWITTDMFNTDDNDKIIEHWDVISEYREVVDTKSGNDMILGDFEIKDLDKTKENKALVRMFITDVYQNENYQNLEKYVSKENFIQHNPNRNNGFNDLNEYIQSQKLNYDFIFHILGKGNFVVAFSKVSINKEELCMFDIFRIEDNKIVEHWDNMEVIPPRNEWVNTGKF